MIRKAFLTVAITLLFAGTWVRTQAHAEDLESNLQTLETSTLIEWSQNLDQSCGRKSCSGIEMAARTHAALIRELDHRFNRETGDSLESISLSRWMDLLATRSDGDRCRLLRTAFVLSLQLGSAPTSPSWRLFTHEKPLSLLTRLGHRPRPGKSPICPDYFFPETDVLEQALSRGARLFAGPPPTRNEVQARVQALQRRYLSRVGIQRSPSG